MTRFGIAAGLLVGRVWGASMSCIYGQRWKPALLQIVETTVADIHNAMKGAKFMKRVPREL
jgi:hypothetical protein